jgi:sugar lactone lactonase YvrE
MKTLIAEKAILGESPLWCEAENALYWVDIKGPHVFRFEIKAVAVKKWMMPSEVGAISKAGPGTFIVCLRSGVMLFEPKSGELHLIANPERARPDYRLNEAKVDPRGRLWVGSVEDPGFAPQGNLYCIDGGDDILIKEGNFAMPNSLGWSLDGKTMYFADSFQRKIWAYDYEPDTANIANRRIFVEIPDGEGFPDGLAIDSEGFVWNAQIDGWCLKRYDPDGSIERIVTLPVRRPTSLAFGGDDYTTLFVTTATFRLTPDELFAQPLAGCVLMLDPGVKGRPEPVLDTSGARYRIKKSPPTIAALA